MSIEKFEERFCIVDGTRELVAIRVITYKDLIQLMPRITLDPEKIRPSRGIAPQGSEIDTTDKKGGSL